MLGAWRWTAWSAAVALSTGALAQSPPPDAVELPVIDVVGVAPIGSPQPLAKVPAAVSVLPAADLEQTGASGLTGALERRLPSVAITEASGNSLQQSLTYRGFEASPIEGTPQGVAVYQNGVRLNEAFGDTMNWDFVPLSAVGRAEVGGNNPAFGLNALGGAVQLKMKNGFTWQGTELEVTGGSYGRLSTTLQHGRQAGDAAAYFAVEGLRDQGFRRSSASTVRRFYGDVGWKLDAGEIHVNVAAADNFFGASAAAPIELLRRDWSAIYTTPQTTRQQMGLVNVTADLQPAPNWSVAANVYMRGLLRRHVDGNTTEVEPCAGGALLCFDDPDTPANGRNGAQLANTFGDAQLGQIDRTRTSSRTFGASLQATNVDRLFGLGNSLRMGLSVDHAATRFTASSELGTIGRDFRVTGSGVYLGATGDPTVIGPVLLDARSTYAGLWIADTLDLTNRLSLTLGGRYNLARVELDDRLGTALDGTTRVSRFNPQAGATYALTKQVTAYAGASQANRAPTPLELGCSDPDRPCLIQSFLVSDPPLKQVVATTLEAGLRGVHSLAEDWGSLTWKAGLFRTDTRNEILNVPSNVQGYGYFANVGGVRRQGLELDLAWTRERLSLYAGYTFLDATFRDELTLSSPSNPRADADGLINVARGDRLPMVPRHRLKAGADFAVTPRFKVHADVTLVSSQTFDGDAANQNPRLPAYAVVNAGALFKVTKDIEVFARAENLFDRRYYHFGTYFETDQIAFANFSDPRTVSPARPRSVYVGARARF